MSSPTKDIKRLLKQIDEPPLGLRITVTANVGVLANRAKNPIHNVTAIQYSGKRLIFNRPHLIAHKRQTQQS